MIYPGAAGPTAPVVGSAGVGSAGGGKGRRMRGGSKKVVQWRQQNVQQGIVIVDEAQLSKLIKRESIEKFYDLDPAPFATGMFASVRRCRSRENGQLFAAKFCSRVRYGEDCSAEIHHELTLLSLCSPSPRIVRLHDVFETPSEVILVLEYAPGGDLQTIIDENMVPFESDVLKFVRQVVEGLAYIHERKIVHLDIKPQNLVMMGPFPDCDIKLCDFEISRVILEGAEVREILGTPDYVAPEIIHYEPITLGADMWSLGVTVYVLLTGFSPFGGETDQETFCNISRCELDFPAELFEDVSPEAQDFVARLLVRQPSARMTAKECLRHPWLAKKPRTPTSHLGHLGGSMSSGINSRRSESPVLVAAAAAAAAAGGSGAAQKNLRKYLSKSREALFERVSGSNLRKTLSKSRERLCESHLSLVSKSRERLLMLEPSSRSIEKLYGLRSLSRSQDALSSKEIWAKNPKLAAQHLLRCKSEGTSLGREIDIESETTTPIPDDTENLIPISDINTENIINPTNKLCNTTNTAQTTVKIACVAPPVIITPKSSALVSKICTASTGSAEKENIKNKRSTLNTTPHYKVDKNIRTENIIQKDTITTTKSSRNNKKDVVDKTEKIAKDVNNKENQAENDDENTVSLAQLGVEEGKQLRRVQIQDVMKNDDTGSDTSDKTLQAWSEKPPTPTTPTSDEDEPRYSVAQLVSAYNKNDQVAASSAITYDKTIPSKLKFVSSFPTGANALRLFIPDIVISDRKQKSSSPGVDMLTDPLAEINHEASPDSSLSPEPSVEEHDEANNNNTQCDNNTECQYLKVPELRKESSITFARSGSLSSEASGYDTLSGASSLVSLEENSSPPISLTTSSSQPLIKPEIKISRPRSSSLHAESIKPPWGTVCTGSYSRAMERFHNKNNSKIHQPHSEKQRRKSTPAMKSSMK